MMLITDNLPYIIYINVCVLMLGCLAFASFGNILNSSSIASKQRENSNWPKIEFIASWDSESPLALRFCSSNHLMSLIIQLSFSCVLHFQLIILQCTCSFIYPICTAWYNYLCPYSSNISWYKNFAFLLNFITINTFRG